MGWWERLRGLVDMGLNGREPMPLDAVRPIPATTSVAHDLELARTLPREVYADWLTERGDIRGELCAIEDPEFAVQFIEAHAEHFYGPLARCEREYVLPVRFERRQFDPRPETTYGHLDGPRMQVAWRHGFVRRTRLDLTSPVMPRSLAVALSHPSYSLLELLEVHTRRVRRPEDLPAIASDVKIGELRSEEVVLREWLAPFVVGPSRAS